MTLLICDCCGRSHKPAARDNTDQPVCAVCAAALLRCCPSPLFSPAMVAAMTWPVRTLPWPDDPEYMPEGSACVRMESS